MKTFEIIYCVITVIATVWISIKDSRERMIPNESIILLGIVGIVKNILTGPLTGSFSSIAFGTIIGGMVFLIPAIATHKIGFGDVKLATVIGLNVGIRGMMYTIIFMGMGVIVYFTQKSFREKTLNLRQTIPLGPFLMMGMIASLMFEV